MVEFISAIFKGFFSGVAAGVSGILPYFAVLVVVFAIFALIHEIYYRKGSYYGVTKLPFISVRSDLGRYGEYLIYKNLKSYEKMGARFLFNVYIPKEDGETTEIDVIMICSKGLFVFESKNYSGWIFGNEGQMNWYQTLPTGKGKSRKTSFYNPIKQNNSHIKHLKKLVGEEIPIYSVIAFSQRCTLKSVTCTDSRISVVKRDDVGAVVSREYKDTDDVLDDNTVGKMYDMLYPLTQVSDGSKAGHIANIRSKFSKDAESPTPAVPLCVESAIQEETPAEACGVSENSHVTEEKAELLCPKCGAALVLRTSKKGDHAGESFYGCSRFPKCRYIKKIDDESTS